MWEVRTFRRRMWKLCAFKLPRAVSRNHRPVDSPETSKNCDFINNSTDATNNSLPEHPFVACLIDGVPVNALLDTGSMKSFISDKVHNIFDFDCGRLDKSQSQRCTSITGGDLHIAGTVSTSVTFSRSKHNYHSSFLVSSNIPYDCVLGWNFITQHKLSVQGDFLGGRSRYQLVGTYGKSQYMRSIQQ